LEDLQDVLGSSTGYEDLEKIWIDGLKKCESIIDRITFSEFKLLMKGQPNEPLRQPSSLSGSINFSGSMSLSGSMNLQSLPAVPEGDSPLLDNISFLSGIEELEEDQLEHARHIFKKGRSQSYEQKSSTLDESPIFSSSMPSPGSRRSLVAMLPSQARKQLVEDLTVPLSPLFANRALYRKHRETRLAVLEASKQFDKKRGDIQSSKLGTANLVMKRGVAPIELDDDHNRALFGEAAKKCGRSRRTRNKTVSDITEMLNKAST
jgi:hypothetical protein